MVGFWTADIGPGEDAVNMLWGLLMAAAGLFMLVCGTIKSDFIIYRLMVARARVMHGEGDFVHRMHQVFGLIVLALGVLWASGVIWG